jgi:hypothetical protein
MSDPRRVTPAVDRVWARLPAGARTVLEDKLAALGGTGWTATLMADAKEHCLISCISTERFGRADWRRRLVPHLKSWSA